GRLLAALEPLGRDGDAAPGRSPVAALPAARGSRLAPLPPRGGRGDGGAPGARRARLPLPLSTPAGSRGDARPLREPGLGPRGLPPPLARMANRQLRGPPAAPPLRRGENGRLRGTARLPPPGDRGRRGSLGGAAGDVRQRPP